MFFCRHVYRYMKPLPWYADEYRAGYRHVWICRDCMKIRLSETKALDLRKKK
nr:MAG TPA: hypothetical protein [Caudoviricetes sp.]